MATFRTCAGLQSALSIVMCLASVPLRTTAGQAAQRPTVPLEDAYGFHLAGTAHQTADTLYRLHWSLDRLAEAIAGYPELWKALNQCGDGAAAAKSQAVAYLQKQAAKADRVNKRDELLAAARRLESTTLKETYYHCLNKSDPAGQVYYGAGARSLTAQLLNKAFTPAGINSLRGTFAGYWDGPTGNRFNYDDCFPKPRANPIIQENCQFESFKVVAGNVARTDRLAQMELRDLLIGWAYCGDGHLARGTDSVVVTPVAASTNKYTATIQHYFSTLPNGKPYQLELLDDPQIGVILTYKSHLCKPGPN